MRAWMKQSAEKAWKGWIRPFACIAVVLCTFRSAVADWNDVPTGSMKPTILEGDRIFVNKLAYGLRVPFTHWWFAQWDAPERGEVVVFNSPADGKRLVKRIIGVPGDEVVMRGNALFINGKGVGYSIADARSVAWSAANPSPSRVVSTETLPTSGAGHAHAVMSTPGIRALRNMGPVTVPDECYLMLGDNRDESADSRVFGFVPRRLIVGRSPGVAISVDPDRSYMPRWGRFGLGFD
jgi:signal peptidase I